MNFRNAVAGLAVLTATTLGAGAAMAAPAYLTISLNLRAGPGTEYPPVVTMPAGSSVFVYGCLSGWSWCDVSWDGYRGWAAGQYLDVVYLQRRYPIVSYGYRVSVPFIGFDIGTYWGNYYHDRPFYGEMSRYRSFYHGGTGASLNLQYNGSTTVNRNTTTTVRRYNNPTITTQQQYNTTTRHYTMSPNLHLNGQSNVTTNGQANTRITRHYNGPMMNQQYQGHLNQNGQYHPRGRTYRCKPGQQIVNGACQ